MKRMLFFLFVLPLFASSQVSIIFSEYVEGSSFNKYLEIYNPTLSPVQLDEYNYVFCWNGCDSLQWEYQIPFDSGFVLQPNQTYILAHHNADSLILNLANQTTNLLSNGNDVAAIFNIVTNSVIDIIGEFSSVAPSNGWTVDNLLNATKDHTLIRRDDVCAGNFGNWDLSNGSISLSEWMIDSLDNFQDIQMHNSVCNLSNIDNLELESSNKELQEVRDILGRNVNIQPNVLLFFIYSDGTIEKRILLE
tara:strand:+ start:358 stop:1104 length:747 start_codon:yes stop_codon:yes gene_type:complete